MMFWKKKEPVLPESELATAMADQLQRMLDDGPGGEALDGKSQLAQEGIRLGYVKAIVDIGLAMNEVVSVMNRS